MAGDQRLATGLTLNLRGAGGPFQLEQEVIAWRDGKGWALDGRVIGQVGNEVVILHGNNVMSTALNRIAALAISACVCSEGSWRDTEVQHTYSTAGVNSAYKEISKTRWAGVISHMHRA